MFGLIVCFLCRDVQINNICKTAVFHLRNIAKIRKFLTHSQCEILIHAFISSKFDYCNVLLSSPVPELSFFPPPIGAEPGRAKRESRIACMRMLRTPPFFPPNRGKNHIWKYFPDSACGAIF